MATFDRSGLDAMIVRLRVSERLLSTEVPRLVEKATQTGETEMRRIVETSGTGWVGKGPRATPAGRIDYGDMIDGISAESMATIGKWGWAVQGNVPQMYYFYQENGFRNALTGRNVPPMHALLGSFIKAREEITRDLDRLVK